MTRMFLALVCSSIGATAQAAEPTVDFNRDVRPILSNNCFACHGPDEKVRKGDLRLDTFDGATGKSGGAAGFVPGKPDQSEILKRVVLDAADSESMPPKRIGKRLTAKEVATLKTWIEQGAKYAQHWSYVKPERPAVPASGAKTTIDSFLSAKLSALGLKPQAEADRPTLIRRVALDLTGLPPTLKEVDDFLKDSGATAYETMLDHMLAKPAFGEHWARTWLDLARYADSSGYGPDSPRVIWPYRDYVIKSLNANKPFDRFTVEQLAGDLLPKPTDDQLTATAFHRNTMTNDEGGTNDEEFRSAAIVDRVNTTMAIWMGTSAACAQCHTHKYDPITQKEYFGLYAILNQTDDADRSDDSPRHPLPEPEERRIKRAELTKQVAEAEKALKAAAGADQPAAKAKVETLKKELAALPAAVSVPVMKELPADKKRVTKLQYRGNFLDLGDVVPEGVPAAFPPLPKGVTANRLALANWLISAENPLTARVAVNRFWEQIFRHRPREDVRRIRIAGRFAEPPGIARLARRGIPRTRLGRQEVPQNARVDRRVPAKQQSDVRPNRKRPGQPLLFSGAALPLERRDGTRSSFVRQRVTQRQNARPLGPTFAAEQRLDGVVRRRPRLGPEPRGRPLPPRALHRMAPGQPVPVDGDVRRPEPRGLAPSAESGRTRRCKRS